MDQISRRDRELPYLSDEAVMEQQKACRRILQEFNTADRTDFELLIGIIKKLFGKSENAFVNPPFYCDYGFHIEVGKNFYANYNCTILDVAKVKIGGNAVILPGVHIGSNVVIGAGSVVTKDIPDWCMAAGSPCRVIRRITEADRKYYFRDRMFDEEAWAEVENAQR